MGWKKITFADIKIGRDICDSTAWLRVALRDGTATHLYENDSGYILFSAVKIATAFVINGFGQLTRTSAGFIMKGDKYPSPFNTRHLPERIDLADIRRVPEHHAPFLFPDARRRIVRPDGVCYSLDLPQEWKQFKKGLKKKFRGNLRSAENRIYRDFKEKVCVHHQKVTYHNFDKLIATGRHVARRSWQGKKGVSVFYRKDRIQWLKRMLISGMEQDFFVLKISDELAAVRWVLHRWPECLFYLIEYDESFRLYRPGHLLTYEVIRRYIKQKFQRIDFGVGDSFHKHEWGAEVRPLVRVMAPITYKGLLLVNYQLLRWMGGAFIKRLESKS